MKLSMFVVQQLQLSVRDLQALSAINTQTGFTAGRSLNAAQQPPSSDQEIPVKFEINGRDLMRETGTRELG